MKPISKYFLAAAAIFFILIAPLFCFAFEIQVIANMTVEGDFVLGPGKVELFLDPGESAIRDLKITNRTGAPLNIFIDIEDFTGDSLSSVKLLGDKGSPYSLKDYIRPEKSEFVLAHGEKAILPIIIKIPDGAEPGGLYGAAIVRAELALDENGQAIGDNIGQIGITTRLASLFFIRVKGDILEEGSLKSFSSDKKFYQKAPVNFSVIYENRGSVHINPYGIIEIKNIMGKKVDSIELTPYFVMPGFSRDKTAVWDKKLAFGRYTAYLQLNRGYGNIVDEAKISFWIVPLKILITSILIIILAAIFIYWFSKKFELKRKK